MDELYLVGYTHKDPVTCEPECKSISFGSDFRYLCGVPSNTTLALKLKIEEQTGDEDVQIIAITALHKLIDYAPENKGSGL